MSEGGKRDLIAVGDHIDAVQRIQVGLEAGINFQHHVILVQLLVDDGNLPLAESVVEGIVDLRRRNTHACRCRPVNDKVRRQAAHLLIAVYIAQFRRRAKRIQQARSPAIQFIKILSGKAVLILRVGMSRSNLQILRRGEIERDAGNMLRVCRVDDRSPDPR